jgi:hypothetical protein
MLQYDDSNQQSLRKFRDLPIVRAMSFEKTSTMESIDASRDDLYWEK